ncbi:hypothetical protein NDU88_009261 [Pleurodeles waltl]|uniref:Uncharacterized protein n=1 Tax=Pleurodeles waltl TaxID=8319 RepID=A0AAV7QR60_PLEWA|nr:hypothetical protein NDU88_009261 [Pleurodeles waltl]
MSTTAGRAQASTGPLLFTPGLAQPPASGHHIERSRSGRSRLLPRALQSHRASTGVQAARRPRSPQGGPDRGCLPNRAAPAPLQSGQPPAPVPAHARVPISGRAAGLQGPAALPFELSPSGLLYSAAPAGAPSRSVSTALASLWAFTGRAQISPGPLPLVPPGILFFWAQSLAAVLAAAGLTPKPPRLQKGPGRTAPAYSKEVRSSSPTTSVREQGRFSPVSVPGGRQLQSRSVPDSRAPAEWWAATSGIHRLVPCQRGGAPTVFCGTPVGSFRPLPFFQPRLHSGQLNIIG